MYKTIVVKTRYAWHLAKGFSIYKQVMSCLNLNDHDEICCMVRVCEGKESRLVLRVVEPGPDAKSSVEHCLRRLKRARQVSSWTWSDESVLGTRIAPQPYEAATLGALELLESLGLGPRTSEVDFNFLLNLIPHLLNAMGITAYKPPYFIAPWKGTLTKDHYTEEELELVARRILDVVKSRYTSAADRTAFLERFLHIFFNCLCIDLEDEEVFQHWLVYWNWLESATSFRRVALNAGQDRTKRSHSSVD